MPLVSMRELLDHAAETDRRLEALLKQLDAAGIQCESAGDQLGRFDPQSAALRVGAPFVVLTAQERIALEK